MIVIRNCNGQDELQACVDLQVETGGYDPTDVIPRKAFLVWQKVGGQVMGAFDTEIAGSAPEGGPQSMVGFLVSLPGVKTKVPSDRSSSLGWKTAASKPRPYLHSHMLAVKEGYRNRGLGAQLKLAQREEALGRGIRHIEWTFDPLEIKNAFLNIRKLGAGSRTYLVDFYGVSSSRLQGGLPTDRLVAEWALDSAHVRAALEGPGPAEFKVEERVFVPAAIDKWKASEAGRERALVVQMENRRRFQEAFSQGLAVLGFDRDAEGNGIYLLGDPAQLNLD